MPHILHEDMGDVELLWLVAQTYADRNNWEGYEIETVGGPAWRTPWILRDRGEYAQRALEIITRRKKNEQI